MLIDAPLFWEQVRLGEDSGLELKEARFHGNRVSTPHRDGLADGFAAFANSGGGRVVLGVTDDREPQSLTPAQLDLLADRVTEICSDSIAPPLDFSVYRVPAPPPARGGVLLVDIPAREPAAATDTQIVRDTGTGSLSPDLWRRYASSRTNDPAEITLTKLKFVKDDRHGALRATVGGVLLAAVDPREWLPNAFIQAVCYDGTRQDGNRQLDALDIGGPLDRQIRDAMQFVVRNRRVAARKRPARSDVPQYHERAVFEAVVNAVVHRDYAVSGSKIRLFMFDDRLELYSQGGLCNSMTTEDLHTSQFTRNELLASGLGQCPVGDVSGAGGRKYFIERRGEGIGVIEDETFALAGRKPIFELIGERELKLVLPAASPPLTEGVAVRVAVRHHDTGDPLLGYPCAADLSQPDLPRGAHRRFRNADFELHTRRPMTVLCAAPGFTAWVARDYVPRRSARCTHAACTERRLTDHRY